MGDYDIAILFGVLFGFLSIGLALALEYIIINMLMLPVGWMLIPFDQLPKPYLPVNMAETLSWLIIPIIVLIIIETLWIKYVKSI